MTIGSVAACLFQPATTRFLLALNDLGPTKVSRPHGGRSRGTARGPLGRVAPSTRSVHGWD